MKVVFAQGNPGTQYARTRHNTGFLVVDTLAAVEGAPWRSENKFRAEIAELTLEGEKVLLVKPQSFYNETGLVARALIDFYKLTPSTDFLVIHDELALPFGTIRVRDKGSDAGNNGIKSLNTHLGPDYTRIRVGIWNEGRNQMDDANFVLNAFSSSEAEQLKRQTEQTIVPIIRRFVQGTLESSSHTH